MRNTLSQTSRLPLALAGFSALLLLLAWGGIARSHGDESHDEATEETTSVVSADTADSGADWDSIYTAIGESFEVIRPILKRACYDCHSTETDYPWYYKLPLVKGLIDDDIRDALKHMDMTDGFPFKSHSPAPANDLLSLKEVLEDNEMPPLKYRLLHWNAKPSSSEYDFIVAWVDQSLRLLAAHGQYPFGRPDLVPGLQSDSTPEDSR